MNVDIETTIDPAISARTATPADHRLGNDEGGLSVVFSWQTDRYAHVIKATGERRLISVEGTPQDDWPASPAISQLSTELIDGRPTVLGVGCSGTTHFSVSVQLDETADGSPLIRFDWAARLAKELSPSEIASQDDHAGQLAEPLAWLGSTYRRPAGGPNDWGIETIADTLSEHDRDDSEQRLVLQPTRIDGGRTVQWSYRVRINHDSTI